MKDKNICFVKCEIKRRDTITTAYFNIKKLVCIIAIDDQNCTVVLKSDLNLHVFQSANSLRERIGGCIK